MKREFSVPCWHIISIGMTTVEIDSYRSFPNTAFWPWTVPTICIEDFWCKPCCPTGGSWAKSPANTILIPPSNRKGWQKKVDKGKWEADLRCMSLASNFRSRD
jgi:hypothetical protein